MANLNMANATYARDTSGKRNLCLALQAEIDGAIRTLKGQYYEDVINIINQNWTGADADKFKANYKETINVIENTLVQYKRQIEQVLNADENDFGSFQNRMASNVRINNEL